MRYAWEIRCRTPTTTDVEGVWKHGGEKNILIDKKERKKIIHTLQKGWFHNSHFSSNISCQWDKILKNKEVTWYQENKKTLVARRNHRPKHVINVRVRPFFAKRRTKGTSVMIIFGVLHVSACSHKINTPSNVLHSLIYYFNTQLNINLTHNWLFTRRESFFEI